MRSKICLYILQLEEIRPLSMFNSDGIHRVIWHPQAEEEQNKLNEIVKDGSIRREIKDLCSCNDAPYWLLSRLCWPLQE